MAIAFAVLVAPFLALTDQAIALSLTAWACRTDHALALHLVHVPFVLATIAATVLAWLRWRETAAAEAASETIARRHFLAGIGIAVSALSVLVILAMWAPTWVLSSCLQ